MTSNGSKTSNVPAILSYGFRPFFLLAALHAAVSIGIWTPWFLGIAAPRSELPPVVWHAHSLLFGYAWAVIAGFLLTAVPNWTGRDPIAGWPLLGLVLVWILGAVSSLAGLGLSPALRAALHLCFPAILLTAVSREIIAARNWRNAKILVVLMVLIAAQGAFHYEVERFGIAQTSQRLAIATIVTLITLIGGRIIPAFTTNWLKTRGEGRVPVAFAKFDGVVMATSVVAMGTWVAGSLVAIPAELASGILLLAGVLHLVRQARWAPERTLAEPLVTILHVAYLFVGVGFLLAGGSALMDGRIAASAAIHAWTTGAIGIMTLAVMTRASLGYTGRKLASNAATTIIYVAIVSSATARIAAALAPQHTLLLAPAAGLLWIIAFLTFAAAYAPALFKCRAVSAA